MNKREKQRDVFIQLVNKQLEPHGKTYEDVKHDPEWYMKYKTNPADEKAFLKWGTSLIKDKLKLNNRLADSEMSWFILQWGLTTVHDSKEPLPVKVTRRTASKK